MIGRAGGMSRIAVIGTGYTGLATASCFADLGNDVCGVTSTRMW